MAHKAGIFVIIRKYFFFSWLSHMKWGGKLPVHDIFFYSKFKLTNRIIQQTKYTLHWNNISCISVYMCCYVYLISGGWTVKKVSRRRNLLSRTWPRPLFEVFFFLLFAFVSWEKRSDRALTNRKVIRWSLLLKLLHHIRVLRQPRNVTAPPLMAWQNTRSWHLMCSIYTLT